MNAVDNIPINAFFHAIMLMTLKVVSDTLFKAPNIPYFLCIIVYFLIIMYTQEIRKKEKDDQKEDIDYNASDNGVDVSEYIGKTPSQVKKSKNK